MSQTIMCVDDEVNLLKLYEHELSGEGFEVIPVASGSLALTEIEQREPDLVILDIKLKDRDGLEVLGEIRKDHPDLPVLLLSGYTTYKRDFHSWLADDYVVKSSDLTELKAKVRELLSF